MKAVRPGKPRSRLSREENKALTRSKIIEVGRSHFLKHGINGTVLEDVAEEAGFSRGAVYSNFKNKAELFLAVSDGELGIKINRYIEILKRPAVPQERIRSLRQAFIDHVTDPVWIVLRTEFETNALNSPQLRKRFLQIHRRDLRNGINLAEMWLALGDITLNVSTEDFILTAQSFMQGLAIKQRLLEQNLSPKTVKIIAGNVFDCLTKTRSTEQP